MSVYADPWPVASIEDCHFYHTMDVPGIGVVDGPWDLRHEVDALLGHLPFDGRRVLEVGPASGFLTFTMERCGAEVVCIEVDEAHVWDFVPYWRDIPDPAEAAHPPHMERVKNSFWLAHAAFESRAKVHYGDACNIPDALGEFDIAVMGSVLLHCQNPVRIVEHCARRSSTVLIADMHYPELDAMGPVCRLVPSATNNRWDTWWHFSTGFFEQYLGVLGFSRVETTMSTHTHRMAREYQLFTVVGHRH